MRACATKLDGSPAASEYYKRRRKVFYMALKYAVRKKRLTTNPLDQPEEQDWKPPEISPAVERRRVPNPAQMRGLLSAIARTGRDQGRRMVGIYGCMYYPAPLRRSRCVGTTASF